MLDYMSAKTLLSSWDHFAQTNTFEYKSDQTGRWSLLYWDLSSAFSRDQNKTHYPSPYDHDSYGSYDSRFFDYAVYGQPDLRQAYYRRLRTLIDKLYATGQIEDKFQEYENDYADEMAEDVAKWPAQSGGQRPTFSSGYSSNIQEIKRNLMVLQRQPWAIPAAQTDAERQQVSIAEVNPSSTNSDEYIKLSNDASTAVDISGWTIEGINYEIPAGAVIPAHSSIYLLRDDVGYRAGHSSVLVAGQYDTDLGDGGALTLKSDADVTIDTVSY
jgi:hypothetical protein